MTQQTFSDDWRNHGLEIKFESHSRLQRFFCRKEKKPQRGDLIKTLGPSFEIVDVSKETSNLLSGLCVQCA